MSAWITYTATDGGPPRKVALNLDHVQALVVEAVGNLHAVSARLGTGSYRVSVHPTLEAANRHLSEVLAHLNARDLGSNTLGQAAAAYHSIAEEVSA